MEKRTDKVVLSVEHLSTYYFKIGSTVKAVDDVSFNVKEGEIVAMVGESGCGKTGTALSVARLIQSPPGRTVSGRVVLNGTDILKLSEEEMRKIRGKEIGMIFQEPTVSFNPVLTIGQQMTEVMMEHLGLTKPEATERACELLDKVGISDVKSRLNQYPFQLSGGMKQRVMIAMALSCNPRLVLADEPTTALDVTVQLQILELIKALCKDMGVAFVIITHNLGIVARYADRVNVMYAGKIIESGTVVDVFKKPKHPYTKGLIGSIPRLDQPVSERLFAIEGQPPDLSNLPNGCYFCARCSECKKICSEQKPEMKEVSPGHRVACHLND